MGLPDSYFCEEHGRNHKQGSSVYSKCLPAFLGEEEAEAEAVVEKPKTRKTLRRVSSDEVLFRLKDGSPGTVAVNAGGYSKTFHRTMQPFVEKVVIFEKVILRTGLFERQ